MSDPNPLDFSEADAPRKAKPRSSVARGARRAAKSAVKDIGNALGSELAKLFTPQGVGTALVMMGGGTAVLLLLIYLKVSAERVPVEQLPDREQLAILLLVGLTVAAFFAGVGIWLLVAVKPSDDLKRTVAGMNNLKGRTRADVLSVLGEPQQTEYGEITALTWTTPHYTVVIGFRDNLCVGILREANH